MQSAEIKEGFKGWAVLELMGHRRLAGYVEEVEVASSKLLQITVYPKDAKPWQQFYGAAAIYCLSPVTEAVARKIMEGSEAEPTFAWDVNRAYVQEAVDREMQRRLPKPESKDNGQEEDQTEFVDPDDHEEFP